MTEPQMAGTPGSESEGGTPSGAGTPTTPPEGGTTAGAETVEQLRARLEAVERDKEQLLGQKSKFEEAQRRLAEYEAGAVQQPPTGHVAPQESALENAWYSLASRDPEAAQIIAAVGQLSQQEAHKAQARIQWREEMDRVPSEDRAEVEQRARAQRIWPSRALNDIKAERWDKTHKDLAEKERRLKEDEDRRRRGVVNTTSAPAPPAPSAGSITRKEYADAVARATAGDGEARKLIERYDEGHVKLSD